VKSLEQSIGDKQVVVNTP